MGLLWQRAAAAAARVLPVSLLLWLLLLRLSVSAFPCQQPGFQSAAFRGAWEDAPIPRAGFHLRRGTWFV